MFISVLQVLALMGHLQWQQLMLLEFTQRTQVTPLSQLTCYTLVKSTLLFMYLLHSSSIFVALMPTFFFFFGASTRCRVTVSHYAASRLHSDKPRSIGLLWTSYQSDAETTTWQHTAFARDRQLCPFAGFETAMPASQQPQTHKLDNAI